MANAVVNEALGSVGGARDAEDSDVSAADADSDVGRELGGDDGDDVDDEDAVRCNGCFVVHLDPM